VTTDITTAQDLIDALLQLREERADLDAKEAFLKEQLAGAIAMGELDTFQAEDGIFQFSNAKYTRCERSTYKLSKEANKAIQKIKEQDIDAGLAQRNVTTYWRLDNAI
jgi:hypothetical protein